MAKFISNHAFFISYCELEKHELFLFTNGIQGLERNTFLHLYENTRQSFDILYQKYRGRICKSIKGMLDDFTYVIDVRIHMDERMCKVVDNKTLSNLTKYSKFDKHDLHKIIISFKKGNINEIANAIKKAYTMMIPLYVIMDAQWLISMQGVRKHNNEPLNKYFTDSLFEDVIAIRDTLLDFDGMHALKEMIQLNFLYTVFQAVNDHKFFAEYSTDLMGNYAHCHLKDMTNLLTRNVDLIILAELLAIGMYDMLGMEWQMKPSEVQGMIERANRDIASVLENYPEYSTMKTLTVEALHQFRIYLKKVERYQRWLSFQTEQDDSLIMHSFNFQQLNDMLFGNVRDKEGNSMTCAICLDTADERKDTWFTLSCGHCYHLECVNKLNSSMITVCPLCRQCID
jgi:hypothetical protein